MIYKLITLFELQSLTSLSSIYSFLQYRQSISSSSPRHRTARKPANTCFIALLQSHPKLCKAPASGLGPAALISISGCMLLTLSRGNWSYYSSSVYLEPKNAQAYPAEAHGRLELHFSPSTRRLQKRVVNRSHLLSRFFLSSPTSQEDKAEVAADQRISAMMVSGKRVR